MTVTASDPYGLSDGVTLIINVGDVNEAPTFADGATATRSVKENAAANAAVGAPIEATDEDGSDTAATGDDDTLTYSLLGTDANNFTIDTATGQITLKMGTTLDHETKPSHSVQVKVRDSLNAAGDADMADDATITVTITVTDVNEAPTFPSGSDTRDVDEGAPAGAAVGAPVEAEDPESDTLAYSLGGTDADKFEIDTATGQITLKAGTELDRVATPSYEVTVSVSDAKDSERAVDPSEDDRVTVTITVVEPPRRGGGGGGFGGPILNVTAVVAGDAPAAPSFGFAYACANALGEPVRSKAFTVDAGRTYGTIVAAGLSCSITVTDDGGASAVDGLFTDVVNPPGGLQDGR